MEISHFHSFSVGGFLCCLEVKGCVCYAGVGWDVVDTNQYATNGVIIQCFDG